jgi:SRSO17 transposase
VSPSAGCSRSWRLQAHGPPRWAPAYLRGLPLVSRSKCTTSVATSCRPTAPLERVLAEQAQQVVGGPGAMLVVDDTTLPKRDHCSVGVAHQYPGKLGKNTNCRCLVPLTLARREVPLPIALRLFLPKEWTDDPARCARVGVPAERQVARTKAASPWRRSTPSGEAGVTFDVLLADAGYGTSAVFRQAFSARGLTWAVGILRIQTVCPTEVAVLSRPRSAIDRRPTYPITTAARLTAEQALGALPSEAWHTITWRLGTTGPPSAACAARRVGMADGTPNAFRQHLPGEEPWLVGERRSTGERRYYLTNHAPDTSLRVLAAVIKARRVCEQAHQQLKDELGLDHVEGRSWSGLPHHALLAMITFAFSSTSASSRSYLPV